MSDKTYPGSAQHVASSTGDVVVTDDLDALLDVLPPRIRRPLERRGVVNLLEVVLDLGRLPEARYPEGAANLDEAVVSEEDLAYVVERIGAFGDDNRAGIERTLHRISAIRNRRGQVVGLTCRVGRAVRGTVALIRDVLEQGKSILILGRPGVGKTTLLREAARVLADELGKRVVVVDTSNEIAGDGDVPHPGIGRARRMQVARTTQQHQVMIEAVENHMPEVIVIDEIGTELEAQAARTIAERGVQLVGTAHGRTLDNLLVNPTLADLVGGVQAVTLGDEEARRRGTQKTVLERKSPPTFDVLVEQEERNRVGVHLDVASAVDGLLRGEAPVREMRERQSDGSIRRWVERAARADGVGLPTREGLVVREELSPRRSSLMGPRPASPWWEERRERGRGLPAMLNEGPGGRWLDPELALGAAFIRQQETENMPDAAEEDGVAPVFRKRRIYPMGINRNRLEQAIRELGLPAVISRDEREADAMLVLKSLYRRQPDRVDAAQSAGLPVYVLRGSSVERLREALSDLFRGDVEQARRAADVSAAEDGDDDEER
ncbi:MAG: Putative regulatory protein, contains AAA+ NTPase domain and putative R3H ssDNA-binding domain [Ktedonobacterales bacterium]|jgi:stage III sporulation protein SpoIIIAA|nr:MAG: Putative regulatory protein, contains AAA+ NTPase domain and putative R3H ssDNA-binding domain [Ktedonobacterales bacterium]